MKKLNHLTVSSTLFLLLMLWAYAAISKLLDFENFKGQMEVQRLPLRLALILVYVLPAIELLIAFLLVIGRTRLIGFYLSAALLLAFTGYVGLVMTGRFGRIPCSCGGILSGMPWQIHFLFNCFFFIITCISIIILRRERSVGDKD